MCGRRDARASVVERRKPGSRKPSYDEPENRVDTIYSGTKAALRPLHERAIDTALAPGDDVIATSGEPLVPLYRKDVFIGCAPWFAIAAQILARLWLRSMPSR